MDIQYNSWLPKFKNPFGAVTENSSVEFNIKIDSKEYIKSVALVVRKETHRIETSEYMMEHSDVNQYKYHYRTDKGSGLYWYYFKITAYNEYGQEFCLYYGNSKNGGEGYQYTNEGAIIWYQLTCFETEDWAPEWYRDAIFYQIFPDRFYNGNAQKVINSPKKNTFIYGTEEDLPRYVKDENGDIARWDFYGGNLKGIKAKIPYLKELGVTALYLNPIFEANSNHRYDTNDFFKIDPVLGTNEEFKDLVATLHEEGMHLILDGVFSHVGRNSQYFNYSGAHDELGAYQSPHSKYYNWFTFLNYPDEYEAWWGIMDLPQINKHDPSYQAFIYGPTNSVLSYWEDYKIDGWRLDVVDELPNEFIKGIRARMNHSPNQVLIGEVWEDASNKVAYGERKEYTSYSDLHGVMNYPLRDQILDLVNERKPIDEITLEMMQLKENYPMHFYQSVLNNIGTHDTKRILTECEGSFKKVALAIALLFMMPGVPCLYYGDEAGLAGQADPDNRRFFPWDNKNKVLTQVCQNWIMTRKSHDSLSKGDCQFMFNSDRSLFAIYRAVYHEESLCIFNFTDFEQEYILENWQSYGLNDVEIIEKMRRFDIPRRWISSHDSLFLVKQRVRN